MEWLAFLRLVKRTWWVVVLVLLGAVGSTAYCTARQMRIYQAATTLVLWPEENTAGREEVVRSLDTLDRRTVIATYAKIPSSQTVQDRARQRLHLSSPVQTQAYQTRTAILPDTNILKVSVEGPDPKLASALANAIAEEAQRYVTEFSDIYRLRPLDPATPPVRPVRPSVLRNVGAGTVLGLLLGLGLAFLMEALLQVQSAAKAARETSI